MFYLPLSLFNFIARLNFFMPFSTILLFSLLNVFYSTPPPTLPHFYCFSSSSSSSFSSSSFSLFSLLLLHLIFIVFPPPPPHLYCFPSSTSSSSFILFSLLLLHHLLLIYIVFPRKGQKAKIRPIRPNSNVMA